MTRLKARLLIAVYQFQQDSRQLTHLATALGVAKSTVSRAVQDLQEEGLLLYSEREIRLTAYGRKQAGDLTADYERFYTLLSGTGVPAQQAADDSYTLLLELSEQARAALLSGRATATKAQVYDVEAEALILPDGIYSLPFAFYKAGEKGPRTLSMANSAFVHPAQLIVKSGRGNIRLKMSPVSRVSPFHDQVVRDILLKRMSYQDGGHRRLPH